MLKTTTTTTPRFTLKTLIGSALLALVLALPASATPTENHGLRVLPAPGNVTIDGTTKGWDLSAGIYACDSVETERDQYATWINAMYDSKNLYILARFTDLTPLNNPGQTIADYGFQGDCLQFRVITGYESPDELVTNWTCWKGRDGADIVTLEYGKAARGKSIRDAKADGGCQQAFTVNADGKGYVQEIAIPWKLLTKDGQPLPAGANFRLTFEPNFTIGLKGRMSIKDLFLPNVNIDRVFTFQDYLEWGQATMEASPGPVKPQNVRLADGREFPVNLDNGVPVPDWTGLIKTAELPGFKTIKFTMPDDGYISLNIAAPDGTVARQLLNNASYTKGDHEVKWDGLSTLNAHYPGKPVPAGDYTWSALFHKQIGLKLRGWAHNSGNTPWDNGPASNWGGDEGNPCATATDEAHVYLGWQGAEAGSAIIACDVNGNVQWKNKHGGMAGVNALASAPGSGTLYVLEGGNGQVFKLNATTGDYVPWAGSPDVDLDLKKIGATLPGAPTAIKAFAAYKDKLYLSFGEAGKIVVVDGKSGQVLQTLDAPAPDKLAVGSDGAIYALSGGNSVIKIAATGGAPTTVVTGLDKPSALTVDNDGNIYVGLAAPANQVAVYDPSGKQARTIGRAGGRALVGKWTPDGLLNIFSLSIASDGKLWVAECDPTPRRFSAWDAKTGAFTKEYFGSTDYGAMGGAISPLDPNVMVGQGCEWKLDPTTGQATCVAVITRDGMGNSRFAVGSNGRLYLAVSPQAAIVRGPFDSIFERTGEGEYKLRVRFRYPDMNQNGVSTTTTIWTDETGDGQEQPDKAVSVPGTLRFTQWYMNFAPDLTLYTWNNTKREANQYKSTGFTAGGAPKYDWQNPVVVPKDVDNGNDDIGGDLGMGSADDKVYLYKGFYLANRSSFDAYDISSGKHLWSYPDNYVGVHGSHNATPEEVGMIRGEYGIAGVAKLPKPIGDIYVIGTNVGEWHVLTGDGFYLTNLFEGDQLKIHWPPQAIPGADMTAVPPGLGGEDFGGEVAYGKDGKLYIQAGKTGFWNLEVTGLDTVQRLPGGSITITGPELAQAETLRESQLQAAVGSHQYTVKGGTPTFTGNIQTDFKGSTLASYAKSDEAAVQTAATWDDQNLYVGWNVTDATPWINMARTPDEMYMTGDTVDLQLGTDPKADKNRETAVLGDLRVSIGNFKGTPTAVIYRKVSETKKPESFHSGVVHDYPMDFVDVLADAKITVKTSPKGYVVEAAIPLSDLGLHPADGLALRGDFGATHGGPDGTTTRLRTYWNNQHTGLVDDAVYELVLEPKNWGDLQFTK